MRLYYVVVTDQAHGGARSVLRTSYIVLAKSERGAEATLRSEQPSLFEWGPKVKVTLYKDRTRKIGSRLVSLKELAAERATEEKQ